MFVYIIGQESNIGIKELTRRFLEVAILWHQFAAKLGDLMVPTQESRPPSLRDQS